MVRLLGIVLGSVLGHEGLAAVLHRDHQLRRSHVPIHDQDPLDGVEGQFARGPNALEKISGKAHEETDKFSKDLHESGQELPGKLHREQIGLRETFLPKWQFSKGIMVNALSVVGFAVAWFFVYLTWIYKDDRNEGNAHWDKQLKKAKIPPPNEDELHPDIIIVFHHPTHKYADGKSMVLPDSITRIMCTGADDKLNLLGKAKKLSVDMADELLALAAQPFAEGEDDDELIKKNVRKSILKDLYKQVPEWGFDIASFQSIDSDELFVCISVSSKESIEYYVDKEDLSMQLRPDIAQKLGVGQDITDPAATPPSIPRNQGIVDALFKQGLIESADSRDLFHVYGNTGKGTTISCSRQCIRIVYRELASVLDLGAAKDEGLIIGWYPVHNPNRVQEFKVTWANWWNLLDWSFVQPIPAIRDYFGAKVAFQFAWNGVYAKGLFMLLLIAVLQVGIVFILNIVGIDVVNQKQVIGFCIVMAMWSKVVQNMYEREERFFISSWNLTETQLDSIVRPQFIGEPVPSQVDSSLTEKVFPKKYAVFRYGVSSAITLIMCALVACCIFLWMVTFEGKMGTVASVLLAVQIKVFGAIFNWIAVKITNYENHKYQDGYYNSFLWKLFLFEFVNNYSAFFFMVLWGKWRNIDVDFPADSLTMLRKQLATTLAVICVFAVVGAVLAEYMVKFWLWWEIRTYKKEHKGKEPPKRLEMEEQAKYAAIGPKEEVMTTMPLMIALGYVLLFGGVSAAIIPLAAFAFALHMRSYATLYTCYAQRTFPQMTPGMGSWMSVVRFLMLMGIVFSGFLFAAFGATFENTPLISRMTGFFLFCFGMLCVWGLTDLVFPGHDGDATLLARRRDHLLRKLSLRCAACEGSQLNTEALEAKALVQTQSVEAVANDEWDKIPFLCDVHQTPRNPSAPVSPHDSPVKK
jgi:hypothetical protein